MTLHWKDWTHSVADMTQFELYTDSLNSLEERIARMRWYDMPYWFPYGIDE